MEGIEHKNQIKPFSSKKMHISLNITILKLASKKVRNKMTEKKKGVENENKFNLF